MMLNPGTNRMVISRYVIWLRPMFFKCNVNIKLFNFNEKEIKSNVKAKGKIQVE